MPLDGLERDVELVGDLAVGAALGREAHDAQLAGGQRLHAGAPFAARAGAGCAQLLACAGAQRPRAAAGGELERLGERFARLHALSGAAQCRPKLRERPRSLQQRRRPPKADHGFGQQLEAAPAAVRESGDAQRDPQRARRAKLPHVGQLGVCQLARGLVVPEPQQR